MKKFMKASKTLHCDYLEFTKDFTDMVEELEAGVVDIDPMLLQILQMHLCNLGFFENRIASILGRDPAIKMEIKPPSHA